MAKKLNLLTIAALGAAAYFIVTAMKKKRGVSVTAESPIKQTESEYQADYATAQAPATPLEKVTSLVNNLFPKKTAEQKAAKKAAKTAKKTATFAQRFSAQQKPANVTPTAWKNIAKKTKKVKKKIGFTDDMVIY
jgi:hypothetical protein